MLIIIPKIHKVYDIKSHKLEQDKQANSVFNEWINNVPLLKLLIFSDLGGFFFSFNKGSFVKFGL